MRGYGLSTLHLSSVLLSGELCSACFLHIPGKHAFELNMARFLLENRRALLPWILPWVLGAAARGSVQDTGLDH